MQLCNPPAWAGWNRRSHHGYIDVREGNMVRGLPGRPSEPAFPKQRLAWPWWSFAPWLLPVLQAKTLPRNVRYGTNRIFYGKHCRQGKGIGAGLQPRGMRRVHTGPTLELI